MKELLATAHSCAYIGATSSNCSLRHMHTIHTDQCWTMVSSNSPPHPLSIQCPNSPINWLTYPDKQLDWIYYIYCYSPSNLVETAYSKTSVVIALILSQKSFILYMFYLPKCHQTPATCNQCNFWMMPFSFVYVTNTFIGVSDKQISGLGTL